MYKNRRHPTKVECRLFCPILSDRCRFRNFLKLLSYRHTPDILYFYIHFRINLVGIIAKTVLIKIYTFKYFNQYSLFFSQILFYFSFICTNRSAPAFHQRHSTYPFFSFPFVSTPLPPPAAPGTHPASKPRGPSPPASSLPCGCFPVIHNVPYALPGTSAASAPDPPPRSPGRICPR